jgi:hypothetical protein
MYVARAHWLFPGSVFAPIQWSLTLRSVCTTSARPGSFAEDAEIILAMTPPEVFAAPKSVGET